MIKELLLSLAVAAASGVSFVGSPKKSFGSYSSLNGTISIGILDNGAIQPDIGFSLGGFSGTYNAISHGNESYSAGDGQDEYFSNDWDYSNLGTESYVSGTLTLFISEQEVFNVLVSDFSKYSTFTNGAYTDDYGDNGFDGRNYRFYVSWTADIARETQDFSFDIVINLPYVATYTLSKNYINCDISSSPVLPSTYTDETAPMKPSYYVLMVANAGGYGFTSESVKQTGGIVIRNFNLIDQYNNSGYYATCSFSVDLPFNDCSITIEAFLPSYAINSTLEHCTVSPAIPSSYTGTSFGGDYTFTAESGYGFNENYTHWEVSNLFVDSVEFSSLLWGSFYSSVTLHLRASGGNSSISVIAIKYDEESYKLGYEEGREAGWQAGYNKGHEDGLIAGDSYGVWNWLKQAARTTGEFLSINLLPGFSIGGLLTALAGLMIIWLFIKGFLFKS